MAYVEQKIDIDAPPSVVWAVLTDVERWPEWTPSTRSIALQDAGELRNTSRARIRLRGMAPSTWQVTEFAPDRSFTWDTHVMRGLRIAARHAIEPNGAGSRVTLSITSTGVLARATSAILVPMSRRNMRLEARGLKRRAEERVRTVRGDGG